MLTTEFLAILAGIAALIYFYLTKSFNHWEKLGVPGPKPKIIVGNFPNAKEQKRNMVYDVDDIYRNYRPKGHPFVGVYNFGTPQLLLLASETVKEVEIESFEHFHDNEVSDMIDVDSDPLLNRNPAMLKGNEWKERRNEITPAFSSTRIEAMKPSIDDVTIKMTEYIDCKTDKNPISGLDTKELCDTFTTDVFSKCIFGADSQSFSQTSESVIRQMGRNIMTFTVGSLIYYTIATMFPFIRSLFKVALVDKDVEQYFTNLMKDAVKDREENKVERRDYLDHLMHMKNISELEMAAHGVTFFVAGFETTSNAMAFMLYALAANPDCQSRLQAEIIANLKAYRSGTYEAINKLPYLDQVLCETLRLYPPVGTLAKKCTSLLYLTGDMGKQHKIEAGTSVSIPITSMHWDPLNYTDPMSFNPDRFSADIGGVSVFEDAGKFLAFGLGPRTCLGKEFAKAIVKIGVVAILQNFELSVNSKTQEPIVFDPREFIMQATGGLWVDYKRISI